MRKALPVAAATALLTACSFLAAGSAEASQLLDRNASNVKLAVSARGVAAITYRVGGKTKRVLARGAINARTPSPSRPQVEFRLTRGARTRFRNACKPYTGPELPLLVAACTAPDNSYWALQSWQRSLPNWGVEPTSAEATWDLRLSHWHGPIAQLSVWLDWVYRGRFHGLFGQLTYGGVPVYGFRSSRSGSPLDSYGRNLYLDTFNSAYGPGWRRENSFLAHTGTGRFCYGFYAFQTPRRTQAVTGHGERYRLTVIGPGVTPDIRWEGNGLPNYDPANPTLVAYERSTNDLRTTMFANDPKCRH